MIVEIVVQMPSDDRYYQQAVAIALERHAAQLRAEAVPAKGSADYGDVSVSWMVS